MGTHRPFRFGVVAARAESGREWVERGRRVEALGYSTLLMPDTLGPTLTPIPALGVLVGATERLRLGTFVLANDLRNPVLLAREWAALDFLSGGRIEIGLGAGRPGAEADNRKLGIPWDPPGVRVDRLAASVGLLKALLAGETVDASGPHYRAGGADVFPAPVQRPRPPVMLAASGPRMLRLAGREADIVTIGTPPTEGEDGLRERIEHIRQGAGDRFGEVELSANLVAVAGQVHPMMRQWGLEPEQVLGSGSPLVLTGSADDMADQLRRTRERLGVSYVTVWDEFTEALAPVVERLAGR